MKLDWHRATISRRGSTYYAAMTVPDAARSAVGQKQIRTSTRTKDRRVAYERLDALEAELREKVLVAVRQTELRSEKSALNRIVEMLHLEGVAYYEQYVLDDDEVYSTDFPSAPKTADQAETAKFVIEKNVRTYELASDDPNYVVDWFDKYGEAPPSLDDVQKAAAAAYSELDQAFQLEKPENDTLRAFLRHHERHLAQRVANKTVRPKTAKSRIATIDRFIDFVGDKPLRDVNKQDAYRYADELSKDYGNKTIKSRISDVSTMLEQAVREGKIADNPLTGLKLANYGTKTVHYTPLSDEQIDVLINFPGLPERVRDLWIILACTGMRLDEAALLQTEQVKFEDGIMFFDLTSAVVKNKSSERKVPVCGSLEPLIRRLVEEADADGRLLPFPTKSDGKSRASEQATYWRMKVASQYPEMFRLGRYTSHSLRGSFKDKLRNVDTHRDTSNAILGHNSGLPEDDYGNLATLRKMKEAVDKAINFKHP